MQGHTEGERQILQYLGSLERFKDDPVVAELLARVPRNLLLRSRGLTEGEIHDLLDRIRRLARYAADHPAITGAREAIRRTARDGLEIALLATGEERPLSAVSHYYELLELSKGDFWGADTANRLQHNLISVLNSCGRFPAIRFRVWGQTISAMPSPPPAAHVDSWVSIAAQLVEGIAPFDLLAAFAVWTEAVEWTRPQATSSAASAALVRGAWLLIQVDAVPSLALNQWIWEHVVLSDAARLGGAAGLDGRMYSALAALDMAAAALREDQARIEALAKRMDEQGVSSVAKIAPGESSSEAEQTPLRSELDSIDQRAGRYLERARAWIGDDLVFHREWNGFVKRLSALNNSTAVSFPSVRHLRITVHEMIESARLRQAESVASELQLATDTAEWIDTPVIPGDWRDVVLDNVEARALIAPVALPNAPLFDQQFVVERARTRALPFYGDVSIVEVQVSLSGGLRGILSFLSLPFAQVAHLDGTSAPVHDVNRSFLQGLDLSDNVLEYLLFFCCVVRGNDEQHAFRIVRGVDDVPFLSPPSNELRGRIDALLPVDGLIPKLDIDNETWRVKALVNFGDRLFSSVFEVLPSGRVEMLVGDPLIADLDVRLTRMSQGLRVLDGAAPPTAVGSEELA